MVGRQSFHRLGLALGHNLPFWPAFLLSLLETTCETHGIMSNPSSWLLCQSWKPFPLICRCTTSSSNPVQRLGLLFCSASWKKPLLILKPQSIFCFLLQHLFSSQSLKVQGHQNPRDRSVFISSTSSFSQNVSSKEIGTWFDTLLFLQHFEQFLVQNGCSLHTILCMNNNKIFIE